MDLFSVDSVTVISEGAILGLFRSVCIIKFCKLLKRILSLVVVVIIKVYVSVVLCCNIVTYIELLHRCLSWSRLEGEEEEAF